MSSNPTSNGPAEQLAKLSKLHADGVLTDEEFKALKAKLIAELGASASDKSKLGAFANLKRVEKSSNKTNEENSAHT